MSDDGSRFSLPNPGVRVTDTDTEAELIVVAVRPDTRADEWYDSGRLVSAENPDHPPWAPVAEVVDTVAVDEGQSVDDLADHDDLFSAPVTRLETANDSGGDGE
jgi:hypothetical protein